MQKWEYRVLNLRHDPAPAEGQPRPAPFWLDDAQLKASAEERLNEFGGLGWEIASISQHPFDMTYVFKRKIA